MSDNNEIRIEQIDARINVNFLQPQDDVIAQFTLRKEDGQEIVPLDYKDSRISIQDAARLVICTPSSEVKVVLDWSAFRDNGAPTFTPNPPEPPITVKHSANGDPTTTLVFPAPNEPHAWHIWKTIGGHIPGFNLRVEVKRKV